MSPAGEHIHTASGQHDPLMLFLLSKRGWNVAGYDLLTQLSTSSIIHLSPLLILTDSHDIYQLFGS
jgi:hypothetical protein